MSLIRVGAEDHLLALPLLALDLGQQGDLDVTAGWGHAGKGGVTMPGAGRVRDTARRIAALLLLGLALDGNYAAARAALAAFAPARPRPAN